MRGIPYEFENTQNKLFFFLLRRKVNKTPFLFFNARPLFASQDDHDRILLLLRTCVGAFLRNLRHRAANQEVIDESFVAEIGM